MVHATVKVRREVFMVTTLWRLWSSLRRVQTRRVARRFALGVLGSDDKRLGFGAWKVKHRIAQDDFTNPPQPSGAEFPLDGVVHHQVEGISPGARVMSSMANSLVYWRMRAFLGSVRIRLKASLFGAQCRQHGNLPMSSGINPKARKSDGSTYARASCSSTTCPAVA